MTRWLLDFGLKVSDLQNQWQSGLIFGISGKVVSWFWFIYVHVFGWPPEPNWSSSDGRQWKIVEKQVCLCCSIKEPAIRISKSLRSIDCNRGINDPSHSRFRCPSPSCLVLSMIFCCMNPNCLNRLWLLLVWKGWHQFTETFIVSIVLVASVSNGSIREQPFLFGI